MIRRIAPAGFRGEWIRPDDQRYEIERRRVFNRRVDHRPPLIARCRGTADVVKALAYARDNGLAIIARSTGWSLAGYSGTDEMVIDMSLMRGILPHPKTRTAWIQGGVTGGDQQIEAGVHGLGAVTGMLPGTGVGLLLGGGVGHLTRRVGYACEQIEEAEIVTVGGEVIRVSEDEHPDLLWAVRGSGGNFGAVTALRVRWHEVPRQVPAGDLVWHGERAREGLAMLRDALTWSSPDFSVFGTVEPGKLVVWACHTGPAPAAEKEVERLLASVRPDEGAIAPTTFAEYHDAHVDLFPPQRALMNGAAAAPELSDEIIDLLVDWSITDPTAGSGARRIIEVLGCDAAYARPPEVATCFRPQSDEQPPVWSLGPGAWWHDAGEDAEHIAWVDEMDATLRSVSGGRQDIKTSEITAAEDARRVHGDAYPRLQQLKKIWDPENVFRANRNIVPAP